MIGTNSSDLPSTARPPQTITEDYALDFSEEIDRSSLPPSSSSHHDYHGDLNSPKHTQEESFEVNDARPVLPIVSFFLGDLRDGLPMINMQTLFLMSQKFFTEKQVGILFFVFGISQTLFLAPAGYFIDYTSSKIGLVISSAFAISALTVLTALLAQPYGENMNLMIIILFIQGGVTSLLPPGFNSITLGIVGSTGFSHQVSRNKMMNHIGTAFIVSIASLVAYFLYPNIGSLFVVSPLACMAVAYYLRKIKPEHVDNDAARGLIIKSPTMTEYEELDEQNEVEQMMSNAENQGSEENVMFEDDTDSDTGADGQNSEGESSSAGYVPPTIHHSNSAASDNSNIYLNGDRPNNFRASSNSTSSIRAHLSKVPSFIFGFFTQSDEESQSNGKKKTRRARTPLAVLTDRNLIIFTIIVFLFHFSNSSVLPLVMQSLAVDDPKEGILLSGLCILVAQTFMMFFAKICGDYSPIWGRKKLFLAGLFSLPLRCFLLVFFLHVKESYDFQNKHIMSGLILSTQLLDAVGAGIFGTLYILVTNDISGGTGRFSLMMGITSGAMCLGGTVSGYIGQAIAEDYGYSSAFGSLGALSLLPAFLYLCCMPETLPNYARAPSKRKRRKKLIALFMRLKRQKLSSKEVEEKRMALSPATNEIRNFNHRHEINSAVYSPDCGSAQVQNI